MKEFTYTIKDELGIHARPAGLLVKEAAKFGCKVTISAKGKNADAKRLFNVMSLGVKCGDEIIITCDGDGENDAAAALEKFLSDNL